MQDNTNDTVCSATQNSGHNSGQGVAPHSTHNGSVEPQLRENNNMLTGNYIADNYRNGN